MNSDTAYKTAATISLATGTVLTVAPADVSMSGNQFCDGAGASALPVGAAMSRTMQLNLDNSDERYASVDFMGAVIRLSLVYGAESIPIGKYTVRQPETYGETVLITGQDDMYKADKPFSSSLTYPTTAGAIWAEICTACGLANGMVTIPQASYVIREAPSGDLTFRAVLGYIAMLSGGNARVNRVGQLEIVNYDFAGLEAQRTAGTATGIHDLTMWSSLRLDTEDVTITGIQTTVYDGGTSTDVLAGAEGYVLKLDNPLFAGNEQAAIETIYAELGGYPFRGFSGDYIAYPLAEFGDGARITDRKGRTYYTIITDVLFTWMSYTSLSNSTESPMRRAASYSNPLAVQTLQKAAQLVAAERSAREQAVQDLADALAAAGGMHVTTEPATGGGLIYYVHDQPTVAASNIVLKLTAEALGISTDGGATYPTGWNFATGTTVTNLLVANGIDANQVRIRNLTSGDLNLYGLMTVFKDSTLSSEGGHMGYGTGGVLGDGVAIEAKALEYTDPGGGEPPIPAVGESGSVVLAGTKGVFLGFHGETDPWFDGGSTEIYYANYHHYLQITDSAILLNGVDVLAAIERINARLVGENLMSATVWQTSGTLTLSKAITGYKKVFVLLGSPASAGYGTSGAHVLSWQGNNFAANQRYTFPCYNGYVSLFITDANTVTIEHADMPVRMLTGYTEQ